MREIVSPLDGFLSPFGRISGPLEIISAVVTPALAALSDGDAIEDSFSANIDQTANYASTAGTITDVALAITVNSVAAVRTDLISSGDLVEVTVTVTDSRGNVRTWELSVVVVDSVLLLEGAIYKLLLEGGTDAINLEGAF